MKKRSILSLVLAGALITMGAGYAAWTDSITIQSTVATGDVSVPMFHDISEEELTSYLMNGVIQINTNGGYEVVNNIPLNDVNCSDNISNNGYSVAHINVELNDSLEVSTEELHEGVVLRVLFDKAIINIENLYPGAKFQYLEIPVVNDGSIPVKITKCDFGEIKVFDGETQILNDINNNQDDFDIIMSNLTKDIITGWEGIVLQPDDEYTFKIKIEMDENAPNTITENKRLEFPVEIDFEQWNTVE